MSHSDTQYNKLRWILTIVGLILYVADIWTDTTLALKYFQEKQYVLTGLTLVFVLAGQLVSQIFSYAWFCDDMNDVLINPDETSTIAGMSKCGLIFLHIFGGGIFTRYYHLLTKGFKVIWSTTNSDAVVDKRALHHSVFCLATDLSMLKLFEVFLESVPQLLLQLYIVLSHGECSIIQYLSIAFSLFNASWALVDYQSCLRRSLPLIKEMPSGLSTTIYLLYKLCTITSRILSYSLLLMLSIYSTIALTIIWLLGTTWAHLLKTNFCSSICREFLYRAVVGVILTFTFFNVKGQNTKVGMIFYYISHALINIVAPSLLALLKPELQKTTFMLTTCGLIIGGSLLGMVSLVLYYLFLHPTGDFREADEVDGLGKEIGTTKRIKNFLQP